MPDGDLTITFGADASGFRQGCDQAATAVSAIAPQVQSLGRALGELKADLDRSVSSFQRAAQALAGLGDSGRIGVAAAGAIVRAGNAATRADNQAVTASVQAQQTAQTNAVVAAAAIQRQVSDQTARHVRNNNDRTLAGFMTTMDQTVASFTRGMLQMAEGSKTFTQVMARVGQQMAVDFAAKVVDPMVEKWLWKEALQLVATVTGAAQRTAATVSAATAAAAAAQVAARAQIGVLIGQAGAGGVASMAAAPWPLDMGAPAFGAAMAGAAAGYMAAGGFDVPAGINPVTQLHAQEMVLPARLANPMRDMLAGFGGPRGGGGGGDAHLHYAPTINAPQGQSLRQMLEGQGGDMLAFIQRAMRDGSLKLAAG